MADRIVKLEDKAGDNLYPIAGGMAADSVTTDMIQDGAVTTDKVDLASFIVANMSGEYTTTSTNMEKLTMNSVGRQYGTDFTLADNAVLVNSDIRYVRVSAVIGIASGVSDNDITQLQIIRTTGSTSNIMTRTYLRARNGWTSLVSPSIVVNVERGSKISLHFRNEQRSGTVINNAMTWLCVEAIH